MNFLHSVTSFSLCLELNSFLFPCRDFWNFHTSYFAVQMRLFTAMIFLQTILRYLAQRSAPRAASILYIMQTCGKLNLPYMKCWAYLHTICSSLLARNYWPFVWWHEECNNFMHFSDTLHRISAKDHQSIYIHCIFFIFNVNFNKQLWTPRLLWTNTIYVVKMFILGKCFSPSKSK